MCGGASQRRRGKLFAGTIVAADAPAAVKQYELFTASTPFSRDPVSWSFGIVLAGYESLVILQNVTNAPTPGGNDARFTSYGNFTVLYDSPSLPPSSPPPLPPSPPALPPSPPASPSPPSLPPSMPYPPSPPMGTSYAFLFTGMEGGPFTDAVHLSEIKLYGLDGAQLPVVRATNPGGVFTADEGPMNLIDGNLQNKWLDQGVRKQEESDNSTYYSSIVFLDLAADADCITAVCLFLLGFLEFVHQVVVHHVLLRLP